MSISNLHQAADTFATETDRFVARFGQVSDEAATRQPGDGGWTPAQIVWHVALTNNMFNGILTGAMPFAAPAPPDFKETFSFDSVPEKIKTFPMLEPPAGATKAEALEKLHASSAQLLAAMRGLSEERCGYCVNLPFATLSMAQFGAFMGRHVTRHLRQLDRAVAQA